MSCWKKKNVQTVFAVITPLLAASDTAIKSRFGRLGFPFGVVLGRSSICRNQRLVKRSYRICGSVVVLWTTPFVRGVMTLLKKTSGSASRTPSVRPVFLSKLRSRPLTRMMNWVGPAAPMESGGNAPVSEGPVTPSHCKPIV